MPLPVQKNSRYNTWYRWSLSIGFGVIIPPVIALASQGTNPVAHLLANPSASLVIGAFVSAAVVNGVTDVFNRFLALSTSTVDQAYQEAWILPAVDIPGVPQENPRYVVVQPHRDTLNPLKRVSFLRNDAVRGHAPKSPHKHPAVLDSALRQDNADRKDPVGGPCPGYYYAGDCPAVDT